MPKIKITCTDPYATDSSSEDEESIEEVEKKTKNGGVFVEEISVSVPIVIPKISTLHLDCLARLKPDSSYRVDESKSSADRPNCVVLALTAKEPEDTPGRKSGRLSARNRLNFLSMAQNCQVDATNSSSKEEMSTESGPTSINAVAAITTTKNFRSRVASEYPGIHVTSSGKWGVRIKNPITRDRIWLGSYSTLEEAINIYNEKKLEYAPLKSKMFIGDASFRVDESKSSLDGPNCTALALTAKETEDTERKNSGIFSVQNRPKRLCMARKLQLDNTSSSSLDDTPVAKKSRSPGASKQPGVQLTSSGKWGVKIRDPVKKAQIWLGSYSTIEEATEVYNKKKLEYASLTSTPLRSKMFMQDASSRVGESKSSVDEPTCIILGLSAKQPEGTRRKKSDTCAKSSGILGPENHPGLKFTSSGKWGVQVQDPAKRAQRWLGTYSTIEEAIDVYNKKKLEYASLRPSVFKPKQHSVPKAKCKLKGKRKPKKLVVEGITVYKTKVGKWRAKYKNPFSNLLSWLRSHSTPEEAVESYNRKMLEFDSSYNCDSVEKSSIVHDPIFSGKEAANEKDKWRVAIRHPMLKCLFSLGLYDTSEEAAEVCNKKKLELEAVLHSDTIACPREALADVASPNVVDSKGVPVKKYKGVKMASSGRWMSQIQGPLSKKNKVYLGTFSTAEEAADTFNRTRREFDAIISLVNKRKHAEDSEGHKKKKKKKTIILDEASMSNGERSRLFEIVVVPKVNGICEPIQENAANTVVSSQGSNNSNDDKQILGLPLVEDEFGADVIDSYGQLVGEYSRLDDELWLS